MKRYQQIRPLSEKINKYSSIILNDALNFYKKELGINVKIKLIVKRKLSNKEYGYIFISNKLQPYYIAYIEEAMDSLMLKRLAHEVTHIQQNVGNKLYVKNKMIYWENKPYMSFEDYNNINNYDKHSNIPWEKEANLNKEILYNKYINSIQFDRLKDTNPNIKFIGDNL